MVKWPTKEDPCKVYKFTSIWLELGLQEQIIERQVYSILEWLGDVGGLFDGLCLVGGSLIAPISSYALRSLLLSQVYS